MLCTHNYRTATFITNKNKSLLNCCTIWRKLRRICKCFRMFQNKCALTSHMKWERKRTKTKRHCVETELCIVCTINILQLKTCNDAKSKCNSNCFDAKKRANNIKKNYHLKRYSRHKHTHTQQPSHKHWMNVIPGPYAIWTELWWWMGGGGCCCWRWFQLYVYVYFKLTRYTRLPCIVNMMFEAHYFMREFSVREIPVKSSKLIFSDFLLECHQRSFSWENVINKRVY